MAIPLARGGLPEGSWGCGHTPEAPEPPSGPWVHSPVRPDAVGNLGPGGEGGEDQGRECSGWAPRPVHGRAT